MSRSGMRRFVAMIPQAFRLVWSTDKRAFLLIIVLQVVNGLAVAGELLVGRRLLETIGSTGSARIDGSIGDILPELVLLAVLAFVIAIGSAVSTARSQILGETVARRVQRQVLNVTMDVSLASFDDPGFHDHVRRSVESSTSRPWLLVNGLIAIVGATAGLVGIMVVLLALQPLIALVGAVSWVPVLLMMRRNTRDGFETQLALTSLERERWYLIDLMTNRLSAAELRALDAQPHFTERYETVNTQVLSRLRSVANVQLRRSVKATGGSVVIVLLAMLLAIDMAYNKDLTVANAIIVVLGVQQLGAQLRGLSGGIAGVYECSLFLDDLSAFFDLGVARVEISTPVATRAEIHAAVAGSVRVDGVTFAYPGSEDAVLRDVSIELAPAEIVALVGDNGSGKTTLAKLLAGLYDPQEGAVWWGDRLLSTLSEVERRGHVALVFQDFLRLHYSVEENISIGDWQHPSPERLRWAALSADAQGFVDALPQGYATRLGREFVEGAELSVGQWQRLVLARTIYSVAPLVIFDEPTAALDPRAEVAFFEQFRSMVVGRTALVISHRMISARMADRVYVLDHGRVVEQGTHQDLLDAGGRYAAMVAAQAGDPSDRRGGTLG